jgi:mRNA interferase RelE/StbE
MSYTIVIKPAARKELEKIEKPMRVRIIETISALSDNPRPAGCKKLVNFESYYRIRVGDYRIIYAIGDKELIVEIVKVGNRRDVYR